MRIYIFIVIRTLLNCTETHRFFKKEKKKKKSCVHTFVYFSIATVEQLCITIGTMVHLSKYG